MICECWQDANGDVTFGPRPRMEKLREQGEKLEKLLYAFEAKTWHQACAEHYKRQGWGEYKPEGPDVVLDRCPAVIGSMQCEYEFGHKGPHGASLVVR